MSTNTLAAWPSEETMIPDLIRDAPEARAVLDRYGLRGCGGALGPFESVGYFARVHEVPLKPLLEELRSKVSQPQSVPTLNVLDNAQPQAADAIYRPFFKAGIAVVLSLGAVWGAYLLLRIALSGRFTAAGLHDVNAHGHAQIFGWVGLFVMGFAYQAFPRFKQTTLAFPKLAFGTLWMMLIGLVVRSVAQPLTASFPWAWWPAMAASVLEIAAIGLFALILIKTWRNSEKGLVYYDGYILCALFWFVVQAVYESLYLAATLRAQGAELLSLVSTWQPALRDIQIHGFALLMILGVSQRIFHHFYGLKEPNAKLSRILLVFLNVAIVGEVLGLVLMRTSGHAWAGLWYVSVLVLTTAIILLVRDWRIFSPTDEADRSLKFLRAGYVWLMISLAMLVAMPLYQQGLLALLAPESAAAQLGFSHAYYGAIRHAITVGFVSLMIMGVAAKVVPTLNGVPSRRLSALWGPFVLINLGCSLRVVGQTATDFVPGAFSVAGISGLLEVTGLALWGGHLWLIMSGKARLRVVDDVPVPAVDPGGPIEAKHTVGAVLEARPELLPVFVDHGFTTLMNPYFRRSIARVVTIESACRRMGVDLEEFLSALNGEPEGVPHICCGDPVCESPHGSTS
jgi:hypothetical protein